MTATAMDTYISTETGGKWVLAWGAGIGGGAEQEGSNITINGGIITASSTLEQALAVVLSKKALTLLLMEEP